MILQCKRHRLINKKRRFEAHTEAEVEYIKVPALLNRQECIRHRSRLPSMRDSRSSGGFEKKGAVSLQVLKGIELIEILKIFRGNSLAVTVTLVLFMLFAAYNLMPVS